VARPTPADAPVTTTTFVPVVRFTPLLPSFKESAAAAAEPPAWLAMPTIAEELGAGLQTIMCGGKQQSCQDLRGQDDTTILDPAAAVLIAGAP
jgi:hypothetical protein